MCAKVEHCTCSTAGRVLLCMCCVFPRQQTCPWAARMPKCLRPSQWKRGWIILHATECLADLGIKGTVYTTVLSCLVSMYCHTPMVVKCGRERGPAVDNMTEVQP